MATSAARIIFMGTPEFAVPSLARLIDAGHEIVAVVTGPDKPRGRGQKLTPTPVKELALAHGLPLLQKSEDVYGELVPGLPPAEQEVLNIRTFYERMWLGEGKKIHYVRFAIG